MEIKSNRATDKNGGPLLKNFIIACNSEPYNLVLFGLFVGPYEITDNMDQFAVCIGHFCFLLHSS